MTTQLEQIRDQQQASWDKFSAGWKKWDALVLDWLAPVGLELLDSARLRPDSYVLDIASGTGEPALSAAARCPQGKVMMTDLAEQMLLVAKESAARRGLRNVETRQCDAGALPFADKTFDAVTARFAFIFFPDVSAGSPRARPRGQTRRPRLHRRVGSAREESVGDHHHGYDRQTRRDARAAARLAGPVPLRRGRLHGRGLSRRRPEERDRKGGRGPGAIQEPRRILHFMNEIAPPVVAGIAKADEPMRAKIKEVVSGWPLRARPAARPALTDPRSSSAARSNPGTLASQGSATAGLASISRRGG
jgi:SAM-dependent methyltransferase